MTRARSKQQVKRKKAQAQDNNRQELAEIRESLNKGNAVIEEHAIDTSDDSTDSSVYVTANTSPEKVERSGHSILSEVPELSEDVSGSLGSSTGALSPEDFVTMLSKELRVGPLSRDALCLLVENEELRNNARYMAILEMMHWLKRSSMQHFALLESVALLLLKYEEGFRTNFSIKTLSEVGTHIYDTALTWDLPWTDAQRESFNTAAFTIIVENLKAEDLKPKGASRPENEPIDFRPLETRRSPLQGLTLQERDSSKDQGPSGDEPGPSRRQRRPKGKTLRKTTQEVEQGLQSKVTEKNNQKSG